MVDHPPNGDNSPLSFTPWPHLRPLSSLVLKPAAEVCAAMHHGPWALLWDDTLWRQHVPVLRNPTPSGFCLSAKNTSRIWTSIWYVPSSATAQSWRTTRNAQHSPHWFYINTTSSPLILYHTYKHRTVSDFQQQKKSKREVVEISSVAFTDLMFHSKLQPIRAKKRWWQRDVRVFSPWFTMWTLTRWDVLLKRRKWRHNVHLYFLSVALIRLC